MNVLLLLLAIGQAADQDDARILERIRDATRENFAAIHSFQLSFHHYDPVAKRHLAKYDWTVSGDRFLLVQPIARGAYPTGADSRLQMSFDGRKLYMHDFDPNDVTQLRSISQSPKIESIYYGSVPLDAFGWRLPSCDQTFRGLLDGPSARLLGHEDVEGNSCWKVDLGVVTFNGTPTNRLTAWFDPAVGYWLRRLRSMPDIVPPRLAPGQMLYDKIAMEFDEFDDLALGGKRWFPTRYKLVGMQKTFELILEEIKLNPPISDDQFTPEIPYGTLITGGPGITPYRLRDPVEEQELAARAADSAARYAAWMKAQAQTSAFDAMASERPEWIAVLWKLLLVVTVVCGGFWWLGRRRAVRPAKGRP
jgi:hypothetical protein